MTDGQGLHPSLFILQKKTFAPFSYAPHLSHIYITIRNLQRCTKLNNEVNKVLHNKIYWKLEFSVCFGFVKQSKNKVYILN